MVSPATLYVITNPFKNWLSNLQNEEDMIANEVEFEEEGIEKSEFWSVNSSGIYLQESKEVSWRRCQQIDIVLTRKVSSHLET